MSTSHSESQSSLIELKNINKYVGPENNQQHILKDVSLKIERGEFIAIIGQSGSGKSTLMNLLGCLDQASSGEFLFEGQQVGGLSPDELSDLRLKSFGFVFQRYNLLNALTALENVALPSIYSNLNSKARNKRAMELLTHLGLADKYNNRPNEMSGGQQQRVSIARALMNGGDVILADEPTGALDSQSGETVLKILEDLHQQGHTIILVTHDKQIAQRAHRMIEIKDGEIIADTQKVDKEISSQALKSVNSETKFSNLSKFYEASKMSIHSILSNKLRSFLTMLGIIIGISSVTIIIAIGNGAKQKFLNDWQGLKEATLFIYPGSMSLDSASSRLNMDDAKALTDLPEILHISPDISLSGKLIYRNNVQDVSAKGSDDLTLKINNLKLEEGRFISKNDVQRSAQIAIVDEIAAKKLFLRNKAALGRTVLFNKQVYEIVGVAKSPYGGGGSEMWVPYTTLQSQMSLNSPLTGMTAIVRPNFDAIKVQEKVKKHLISRHGVEDFQIYNSDEQMKSVQKYLGTMTFFVSCVAFISLLVGGIGVMNIMLVSVTERIKEIGLRMAVGAKQHDVQAQFLIEASVLCLLGGGIGLSIAFISSIVFNIFSPEFKMVFSWWVAFAALLFSSLIGLLFGYMPAKRASKLKPIEALAHE